MNIQIMSRLEIMQYCIMPHFDTSAIISINNIPTETFPKTTSAFKSRDNGVQEVLSLYFNDEILRAHQCMTEEDAEKVAIFARKYIDKVDTLIVHCQGGISRSAGVAGALMKFFNKDDTPAFSGMRVPNMTCYRLTMNALVASND